MTLDQSRITLLQRTAWASTVLVFFILVSSAFIRLSTQGLDCTPWPQCYGQPQETSRAAVEVMRVVHRLSVFLLTPLLLLLIVRGFAHKPTPWPQRWSAVGMTVIAVLLAVLGRWTAGSRLPAIALGNLIGGFVLFAVSMRMATARTAQSGFLSMPTSAQRWRGLAIVAVLLQTALGGLVGSSLAALSCPSLPLCSLPEPMTWQILNPWHMPPPDLGVAAPYPAGAILHWLHRGVALVVGAMVLLTAHALWRGGRHLSAAMLLGLLLAQALLGPLLVIADFPLLLALIHNALTALLLALLVALR